MQKKLFLFIVATQMVIIVALGYKIMVLKKQNILGVITVSTIDKNSVSSNKKSTLDFFYEPHANSIDNRKPAWLKKSVKININSDTLNERRDYALKAEPNTYRIIAVGDSFTYGQYIDTEKNWTELLEDRLNSGLSICKGAYDQFEVINLGVKGYDIEYGVERYRLRAVKYNPDLVIWMHVNHKRINEKLYPFISTYPKRGDSDVSPEEVLLAREYAYEEFFKNTTKEEILSYQADRLLELNTYFTGPLIIAFWPVGEQEYYDIYKEFALKRPNTETMKISLSESENFLQDGHPSELGHVRIAELMFNFLHTKSFCDG